MISTPRVRNRGCQSWRILGRRSTCLCRLCYRLMLMVSIARLLLSRSIEWLILNTPLQLINILDSIKAVYYISKSGIKSTLPMHLLNMQLLSSIGHCSGVDTKNPDELKKIDKKVEAKVKGSEFSLQFCEVILLSLPNIEDSFFYCCSI